MDNDNNCAVKIAVRQGPQRRIYQDSTSTVSLIKYPEQSSNTLIVEDRVYTFDHVFGPAVTQEQLYNKLIEPLVEKLQQGFNCTALAYGQTGTGKSYTMGLSADKLEDEHVGVITRCLRALLLNDENLPENVKAREISASFIEIYNEKAYDLLAENSLKPIASRGVKLTGSTRKLIKSIEDLSSIFTQSIEKRHVRPTNMNMNSSRSHAIFTIHLRHIFQKDEKSRSSCLNIVDLAGSEGVRRTGHSGVAMSEGVCINQGLLSINKVLHAMAMGHKVIPYRDSVLTSVLQNSLNPNSYLTLLACISAHRKDITETFSTIRFAHNAKQIKRTPQINLLLSDIKRKQMKTPLGYKRSLKVTAETTLNKYPFSTHHANIMNKQRKTTNNTFCTPSKIKRLDMAKKCNQSEIGLTPKEKMKTIYKNQTTSTAARITVNNFGLAIANSTSIESLMGDSGSLTSLTSLNISTSTVTTDRDCNFSPIDRLQTEIKQHVLSCCEEREDHELKTNVKCQLFTSSRSPMFKIPEIPQVNVFHSEQSDSINSTLMELNSQLEIKKGQRRSIRIAERTKMKSLQQHKLLKTQQVDRRRSLRIAAKELPNTRKHADSNPRTTSTSSSVQSRRTTVRGSTINNSVIASYFNEEQTTPRTATSQQAENLIKHRQAVLDMLNTASIKDLQVFPKIGKKTAYQFFLQRKLYGAFENWEQVENLVIWRGSAWERFAKANCLI